MLDIYTRVRYTISYINEPAKPVADLSKHSNEPDVIIKGNLMY